MMKKLTKILALLLLICTVATSLASCDAISGIIEGLLPETGETPGGDGPGTTPGGGGTTDVPHEHVDYVSQLTLDMNSDTLKLEVEMKQHIDGDTTHFYVPKSVSADGVLKARYLAINTPESTGKIEEYGKKASRFTKEKLSNAVSIIIESDNGTWNADSTGDRYLVWVWYKPTEDAAYRNLNLEILQEGLAIASNTSQNRYGTICVNALNQAKTEKLNVHSKQPDPEFYYGDAYEITLKELRTNIESYNGKKVAFEGVITLDFNNGVYVEDYDEETGTYFGIYIYYAFNQNSKAMEILRVGNKVRIVGSVQPYNGAYQISDINYRVMKPNDPNNIQKIEDGHTGAYREITADEFVNGKVTLDVAKLDENSQMIVDENGEIVYEEKTFDYAELALGTTVVMKNLKVKSIYTTNNGGSSDGAMTLTCEVNGVTVSVRTNVLYAEDGKTKITAEYFSGKTIDVHGIVDIFDGEYQIKVFVTSDVTVH
jgi:endonuclease YncB( thermonuclease family)/DNA/RNA endonuclease YhcR with UshA esterase domain